METKLVTTTLEEYFRSHEGKAVDFRLRIDFNSHGESQVTFYIHPENVNGDTLDFKVTGNTVECFTRHAVNLPQETVALPNDIDNKHLSAIEKSVDKLRFFDDEPDEFTTAPSFPPNITVESTNNDLGLLEPPRLDSEDVRTAVKSGTFKIEPIEGVDNG